VRTIVKGKNLEVAEADRRYAHQKLARLERLLGDRTDALVELSTESHRSAENGHIVEVTLVIDGTTLRGAASAPSHRVAIDEVIDKLERRAVAHKSRPRANRRAPTLGQVLTPDEDAGQATADEEEAKPKIVTTKRFAIEPMFEEDAVARMEELGHSFFVFVNAENEQLAVLYRRKDGDYGLIEPTVGGEYTPGQRQRGRRKQI
jgi:putative sigma-54 modulation protein